MKRAVVGGPLYGISVYFFMNSIVLPLSAVRQAPFSFSSFVTGLVIHMLFVGLPISLVVGRFAK
ncbi:MAG TPA: hypothetical protein VNO14_03660 [Blastocatellia bacterium]|nr:hypothetical protein [Blastocatellia bacterium]